VNFLSDNAAPVAPDILNAIVQANEGFATAYGDDDWTRSVEHRLAELFEREVGIFLVATGTAANALALAHVTPPWGAVLCHADSHVATDECGAPEFFGGGLKLVELPGGDGKITTETLKRCLADKFGHSPHQMIASTISITRPLKWGPSIALTRSQLFATSRISARLLFTWMARVLRMRWLGSTQRRRKSHGSPVSTCCHSVQPRPVRSLRKLLCFSIRRARALWLNVESAPVIFCLSIDFSPHNLRRYLRMADGSPSPATRISWPISSQPSSPRLAWRRSGQWRPISCSSQYRVRLMRGSRPLAPGTMGGQIQA
jgi:hypothetical protein